MAREILSLKYGDKRQVDHISHDTLNNCRSNLRICTHHENHQNRRKRLINNNGELCSSIYRGISWRNDVKKWRSKITFNSKQIHLGYFDSEIDAARVYDIKAIELFGEYANLNF